MGRIIKFNKTKKKRDKAYDPYKILKSKTRDLLEKEQEILSNAMEVDENGEVRLDESGNPVFKGCIEWMTDSAQIMAIWTTIKAVLEALKEDLDSETRESFINLMIMYAKEHRYGSTKSYAISVPINYFVGTRHILNTAAAFNVFKDDPEMGKAVYGLEYWFSEKIDMYQYVKKKEQVEETSSPDEILSLPKKHSNVKYYSEEEAKTTKGLHQSQDHSD